MDGGFGEWVGHWGVGGALGVGQTLSKARMGACLFLGEPLWEAKYSEGNCIVQR